MPLPDTDNAKKQVKRNTEAIRGMQDRTTDNRVFRRITKESKMPSDSTSVRRAITVEDAGLGNAILVNFFDSSGIEITTGDIGVDYNVPVLCNISGGSDLNTASRLLENRDELSVIPYVYDVAGEPVKKWTAIEGFDVTEECICEELP